VLAPDPSRDELLVRGVAVGVGGTHREIVGGVYGWAPSAEERLIIGHESLGRVDSAPAGSDFAAEDLVAGAARRPDPEPCGACVHDEWDLCRNGRYPERGPIGLLAAMIGVQRGHPNLAHHSSSHLLDDSASRPRCGDGW
jgi:threonine dehydrogenase-like Zn-dependent dehydrogenase